MKTNFSKKPLNWLHLDVLLSFEVQIQLCSAFLTIFMSGWLSVSLVGHVRSPDGSLWTQLGHCHYNRLMNDGAYESKSVDNKGLSWDPSWLSHTLTGQIHVQYRIYWRSLDDNVNLRRWIVLTPCYIYAKTLILKGLHLVQSRRLSRF